MKRAVSVSLGSSERDKEAELELFGETVIIERRGVDGDVEKATALFEELDGQVGCFGRRRYRLVGADGGASLFG